MSKKYITPTFHMVKLGSRQTLLVNSIRMYEDKELDDPNKILTKEDAGSASGDNSVWNNEW